MAYPQPYLQNDDYDEGEALPLTEVVVDRHNTSCEEAVVLAAYVQDDEGHMEVTEERLFHQDLYNVEEHHRHLEEVGRQLGDLVQDDPREGVEVAGVVGSLQQQQQRPEQLHQCFEQVVVVLELMTIPR